MRSNRFLCFAIACCLTACASVSTRPSPAGPTPLQQVACPPLQPLAGSALADAVDKLIEVGTLYRQCRAAHGHPE